MRINLPVTDNECLLASNKTLVTKTNTKGMITFANLDFVEISGFSAKELVGTNHNIIRHPDMPTAVFDSMWKTLKQGFTWHGIVKNRCKNGDFYWVDAKIVPIKKNGLVTGYMSVRTQPTREDVANAEALYKLAVTTPDIIKEQCAPGWKKYTSIKAGIPMWISFVTFMMVVGGILGIGGLNMSKSDVLSLQRNSIEPLNALSRINFLMADNYTKITMALHKNTVKGRENPTEKMGHYLEAWGEHKKEMDQIWDAYLAQISDQKEKKLADRVQAARTNFLEGGVIAITQVLKVKNHQQAILLFDNNINPLYENANVSVSTLLAYVTERGKNNVTNIAERSAMIVNLALAGIVFGIFVLCAAGLFFYRITALPLEKAVQALEDIAEGNLSSKVDTTGFGEPGRVMAAVMITQMHLKVMMHEIQESSKSIREQCFNLNQVMMNLAEHSEEQHDRVHQCVNDISDSTTAIDEVTGIMESILQSMHAGDEKKLSTRNAPQSNSVDMELTHHELLDIFGEIQHTPLALPPVHTPLEPDIARSADNNRALPPEEEKHDLDRHISSVVSAARVQSFVVNDLSTQLNKIAELIEENRTDVQGAWAASQQLEITACELDKMVKYFD